MTTRISKNFTLEEFLLSGYAARHDIDMTPSEEIEQNIRNFVSSCLQPLRDEVNSPISITSGYRPLELNIGIGGSKTSAHVNGDAADFTVHGQTPYDTAKLIEHMDLPYDQVIHEFGAWVHMGVGHTLRNQELTAHKHNGKTRYVNGILTLEQAAAL
jgi:hypothetical protein